MQVSKNQTTKTRLQSVYDRMQPGLFTEKNAELLKSPKVDKFIRQMEDIINYNIIQHNLTDVEIGRYFCQIGYHIIYALNNKVGGVMSFLDTIMDGLSLEETDSQKILAFCQKMQEDENSKNEAFWNTPEIKMYFRGNDRILNVLVNQDQITGISLVVSLQKDLISETFLMSAISCQKIDGKYQFVQKSKIILYNDMNGEKPPKSKDLITKYVIKLKEVFNRYK